MPEQLTLEPPDTEETTGRRRVRDPELAIIEKLVYLFDELDPPGQRRALLYLRDRKGAGANEFIEEVLTRR